MLAPRRVGKTSLMLELRRAPRTRWHVVYVDVEGAEGPADCVAAILAELAASEGFRTWLESVPFARALGDVLKRLTTAQVATPLLRVELGAAMRRDWSDAMDQLQARLATLPGASPNLLIVVDELPVLVARMLWREGGVARVELFLGKLRGWRQSPGLRGKVLTLLGGSVGLEGVLRRAGVPALINDLAPFRLESWNREVAASFLHELGATRDFRLDREQVTLMLDLLRDPVPYHVQLFFHELVALTGRRAAAATSQRIQDCFAHRLAGPGGTPHLDHYATRLELMLDAEAHEVAQAVLSRACEADGADLGDIIAQSDGPAGTVRTVLHDLEAEGYVRLDKARLSFRSNLLRTWWHKHHGADLLA